MAVRELRYKANLDARPFRNKVQSLQNELTAVSQGGTQYGTGPQVQESQQELQANQGGGYTYDPSFMTASFGGLGMTSAPAGISQRQWERESSNLTGNMVADELVTDANSVAAGFTGAGMFSALGQQGVGNMISKSLGGGMLGKAAGSFLIPGAASAAGMFAVEEGIEGVNRFRSYNQTLDRVSSRFITDEETRKKGGGFTESQRENLSAQLMGFSDQTSFSDQQVHEMIDFGARSGQFAGVSDSNEFKEKFKKLADKVKEVTETLNQSLEEGMSTIQYMDQLGYQGSEEIINQVDRIRSRASVSGQTTGQMMNTFRRGTKMARQMGMSPRAGGNLMTSISANLRNRKQHEELPEGVVERYGGIGRFSQKMAAQSMNLMENKWGDAMIAAFAQPDMEDIDRDKMQNYLRGESSIPKMARQNMEKGGYYNSLRDLNMNRPELMSDLMEKEEFPYMMVQMAANQAEAAGLERNQENVQNFLRTRAGFSPKMSKTLYQMGSDPEPLKRMIRQREGQVRDRALQNLQKKRRVALSPTNPIKQAYGATIGRVSQTSEEIGVGMYRGVSDAVSSAVSDVRETWDQSVMGYPEPVDADLPQLTPGIRNNLDQVDTDEGTVTPGMRFREDDELSLSQYLGRKQNTNQIAGSPIMQGEYDRIGDTLGEKGYFTAGAAGASSLGLNLAGGAMRTAAQNMPFSRTKTAISASNQLTNMGNLAKAGGQALGKVAGGVSIATSAYDIARQQQNAWGENMTEGLVNAAAIGGGALLSGAGVAASSTGVGSILGASMIAGGGALAGAAQRRMSEGGATTGIGGTIGGIAGGTVGLATDVARTPFNLASESGLGSAMAGGLIGGGAALSTTGIGTLPGMAMVGAGALIGGTKVLGENALTSEDWAIDEAARDNYGAFNQAEAWLFDTTDELEKAREFNRAFEKDPVGMTAGALVNPGGQDIFQNPDITTEEKYQRYVDEADNVQTVEEAKKTVKNRAENVNLLVGRTGEEELGANVKKEAYQIMEDEERFERAQDEFGATLQNMKEEDSRDINVTEALNEAGRTMYGKKQWKNEFTEEKRNRLRKALSYTMNEEKVLPNDDGIFKRFKTLTKGTSALTEGYTGIKYGKLLEDFDEAKTMAFDTIEEAGVTLQDDKELQKMTEAVLAFKEDGNQKLQEAFRRFRKKDVSREDVVQDLDEREREIFNFITKKASGDIAGRGEDGYQKMENLLETAATDEESLKNITGWASKKQAAQLNKDLKQAGKIFDYNNYKDINIRQMATKWGEADIEGKGKEQPYEYVGDVYNKIKEGGINEEDVETIEDIIPKKKKYLRSLMKTMAKKETGKDEFLQKSITQATSGMTQQEGMSSRNQDIATGDVAQMFDRQIGTLDNLLSAVKSLKESL